MVDGLLSCSLQCKVENKVMVTVVFVLVARAPFTGPCPRLPLRGELRPGKLFEPRYGNEVISNKCNLLGLAASNKVDLAQVAPPLYEFNSRPKVTVRCMETHNITRTRNSIKSGWDTFFCVFLAGGTHWPYFALYIYILPRAAARLQG